MTAKKQNKKECTRCNREGHTQSDCYAKTKVKKQEMQKYLTDYDELDLFYSLPIEKQTQSEFRKIIGSNSQPKSETLSTNIGVTFKYTKIWYKGGVLIDSEENYKADEQFISVAYQKGKKQDGIEYAIHNKSMEINEILKDASNVVISNLTWTYREALSTSNIKIDKNKIPMKSIKPLNFNCLNSVDMNQPEMDGDCVIDYILKIYKPRIPSLTKEKLMDIFKYEGKKTVTKIITIPKSDHDYGLDIPDKQVEVTRIIGITTEQIKNFCEKYKISHIHSI